MADEFDVVVIGAGPPGENAAGRAVKHGLTAAIVEERLVGGECSFYACIPTKTLIRPGDVVAAARRAPGAAEAVTGPIDVAAALAQRDYMTSDWSDRTQTPWLDEMGIELVRGHGRLAGDRAVEVDLSDRSGTRRLTARRALLDEHRGQRREGDTAAVPGARRGAGRRRAGTGVPPAGQRGGDDRRGRSAPAGPRGAVRRRAGPGGVRGRGDHGDHRGPDGGGPAAGARSAHHRHAPGRPGDRGRRAAGRRGTAAAHGRRRAGHGRAGGPGWEDPRRRR